MRIVEISDNFIRPSDTIAYISGDLIANSTTAVSVVPLHFSFVYGRGFDLNRVCVEKTGAVVTNASWRLHLYKDSPTVTNGDNGVWLSTMSNYLGFIDVVGTAQAFSDDGRAYGVYVNNAVRADMVMYMDTDKIIYGLLEARAAYVPEASETFTIKLIGKNYI